MVTRTRPKKKAAEVATEQEDFYPDQIASGTTTEFQEDVPTEAEVLELPDGDEDDDGSQGTEPVEDDPSATNALGKTRAGITQGQQAAKAELSDYMRRMHSLVDERNAVNQDIKELTGEMKGKGYDVKALKVILAIDSLDDDGKKKRRQQNDVNATYAHAVGIEDDLL